MYKNILIIFILIAGFSITLQAQEDTSMTGSKKKLRIAIKEKFMQKLNIDEATANKFFNLYNEQRKINKDFKKNKKDLMKLIEENPDASDVMSKINQLIEIDDKITKSRKDFVTELQKFLTPKQIAQSITFQKNLKKLFNKRKEK
ncbi:MAG: hypothetical protein WC358_06610 [Ignavibacteria bacterium]|jgi:Spy/CpxP family protein refolding chaperone